MTVLGQASPAAASTIIFDSLTGLELQSSRGSESSPGSLLQFSSNVTINHISVRNDLDSAGD
jgi:hypothetical protein